MDSNLLGGNASLLLQLLDNAPRQFDRLSRQQFKSVLERIEEWSIPKARLEVLFSNLGKKDVDIEVLKKAQELVSARVVESLESEIVQKKSEFLKWEIELLKGTVFKVMKENQILHKEAQEFMHEIGQKDMEMETIRRTAEELTNEVGEKSMEIEALRTKAAAEIQERLASSMRDMTSKAEEIESLQKQLAEKARATEVLEKKKRAITSRHASSMKAMRQRAKQDELKIESLQKQLAEKDLEDVRAAKRSKLKGGAQDIIGVKVDEEAAGQLTMDYGAKDNSIVNDGSNHLEPGIGAKFGEDAVGEGRFLPVLVPDPGSEDEEMFSRDRLSDEEIFVPNAEFHEFDVDRMEEDILPGQIWAVYDDQDGMPRFYVRVSRVTTKPFKAHVDWLENCSATDEEISWRERTGLSIACGLFKLGKSHVVDQINVFSHFVLGKVGTGQLQIKPSKGQVWAVYRDPELDGEGSMTCRTCTRKYDVVEILSVFCEKLRTGMLVKVRGFNTVFCRQEVIASYRSFRSDELVRFSHNIPIHRIEDSQTEARNIPRGSLELDPAATPDCIGD